MPQAIRCEVVANGSRGILRLEKPGLAAMVFDAKGQIQPDFIAVLAELLTQSVRAEWVSRTLEVLQGLKERGTSEKALLAQLRLELRDELVSECKSRKRSRILPGTINPSYVERVESSAANESLTESNPLRLPPR